MGIFGEIAGGIVGDLLGGAADAKSNRRQSKRDYVRQKEFAQNSIQWRTEDAQAAGLHPLFAMGGATQSFQPSYQTSGSAAGDAIRRITDKGVSREREGLQNDLIREQIKTSQSKRAENRANSGQDQISPSQYFAPGFERRKTMSYNPLTSALMPFNGKWKLSPTANAEFYEERYGELGQWVGGIINVYSDIGKNISESKAVKMAKKLRKKYKGSVSNAWATPLDREKAIKNTFFGRKN